MELQMGILFLALLGLSSALVCPDGSMCKDKNTCCKNTMGGFGCCPLPRAECCSDHVHCCFEGTVCDVTHSKCVNKTVSLPWMRRVPTEPALPVSQLGEMVKVFPDQDSDNTTCCQLRDGSWDCCPLAKAVCCEDKLHCCPENTKCDLAHSTCVTSSLESFPMLEKLPARRREDNPASKVGSVICPSGQSSCPERFTCCLLTSGDYGCCPYPQAVCCEDKLHCCPEKTKCHLAQSTCVTSSLEYFPMLEKLPARKREDNPASKVGSVTCPDGQSSCPESFTCCLLTSGDYGCCPYPQAVCCEDKLHCCPEKTKCDLAQSTCVTSSLESFPMLEKLPARRREDNPASKVGSVTCPDGQSSCPESFTCCLLTSGDYGCCPYPQAVCCEDKLHCCPEKTKCDLAQSTCVTSSLESFPMLEKLPARRREDNPASKVGSVTCPDGQSSCPESFTCCLLTSGDYGCCPYPQAVCCEDKLHCCPEKTKCDLAQSTCVTSSLESFPMLEKLSARRREDNPASKVGSVTCPDGQSSCPESFTCCLLTSGDYGCCPYPQVPALNSEVEDEKCDKQTMCPGGTTCCKKVSGQLACCPLPQAVCCDDHEHCCPKGYKCNVAEQMCDKPGELSLAWLQKIPALQKEPSRAVSSPTRPARNMCDAQTSCPKDTTCCFMDRTHKWGCCPLPKAVCCTDGNHCCPSGHTCEPHRSSCSKGPHVVIPWFTKLSALTELGAVTDVKCDNKSSCASGTTCCKLQTGDWACCPLVKSVCCADHEHCCPQGYTCNMETGTCEKKNRNVLILTLPQSKVVQSERRDPKDDTDVPCDSTEEFHCPEQDTCCKVSATAWACCPSPRAVCCPDSKHCCPVGYSCDLKAGGCTVHTQLTWDTLIGDRKKDVVPHGL
ncbi:granulin b isoform X2 [Cottoperca gobio]|uniref:Granulin b isoform X2 n=1 Tax=Cottoperca gobio TaxID=56716 RepID=A0A6J2RRR2_COTGO|nr:progranulin isoform X2 [Cottoperca gobio]